ncbi:hypothetical protein E2C01_070654 [Portunus trituberculatus]|uniref:Uncharacterized protein n=1 Tax=Portunus trituberculatus TaxID=210409 RepID=A0A5B7I426_PORTR|nr:hypothetical protein [Portunus trituberculatus]
MDQQIRVRTRVLGQHLVQPAILAQILEDTRTISAKWDG